MIPKQFDDITKADIDALLATGVPEGRTIEYKRTLPGNTDQDKKECLADISSFANAAGGDLLYGLDAQKGIPSAIPGLEIANADAEIQRLDSMIQTGLDPRIPGVRIKGVGGFPQGPVLLVRIPQSWTSPHMVTFKGTSRFHTRNSAGKYQMDVTEIRAAFLMAEAIPERIRRFRDSRLSKIVAGETPLPMDSGAKMILHLLPVSSFSKPTTVDVVSVSHNFARLPAMGALGFDRRMNLDGCVTYQHQGNGGPCYAYTQLFRSGVIESVDGVTLIGNKPGIPSIAYEEELIRVTDAYVKLLRELSIEPPVIAMLSMVGVKGFTMILGPRYSFRNRVPVIDRDLLLLPEIVIEDLNDEAATILRPIFDTVWQSAGLTGSSNYNKDGKWCPQH
ncbi:MAG: ATP-binding protein [Planctomycetaceae bacterium]|nr:ATP-binding protein [Planctomycetaceae bacterium]